MLQSDAQLEGQVAVPGPGVPIVRRDPVRAELEDLLVEVNALGVRLRQAVRGFHSEDDSAFGGQDVLQILSESDGQTVPQIARIRATSRQNIQILVNRLKSRGCVELINNPAHRKSALVRLTARGRASLAIAVAEQEKLTLSLLPHFTESEICGVVKLLRRLRQLLSAPLGSAKTVASELDGGHEKLPRQIGRKKAVSNDSEPKPTAWDSQFDENELPVNLL